MQITTVGLDVAKSVFQVHAINAAGEVVVRRALRRAQVLPFFEKLAPCLVGIEACGTSHHWARELGRLGHEVRLMPPAYVKAYVKRGKTDAADAEAICEAVSRPTMRFVAIKSVDQQAALSLHRARDLLVRQRTQLVNLIRGLLAEFGVIIPRGITHALAFARRLAAGETQEVPDLATKVVGALAAQALAVQDQVHGLERELMAWYRANALARRIATVPGRRLAWGHGLGGDGHRSGPVPLRAPVRRLARAHPAAELQRRQGAVGRDLQDGRPLPASAVDRRHDLARAPGQAWSRDHGPPAGAAARAQAGAGRHRGHGQQGRPGDLGDHDPRRRLPRAATGLTLPIDQRRQDWRASEVARAM
jgi:transposase